MSLEGLLWAGWASKPEGAGLELQTRPGNLSLIVPASQALREDSVKCGFGACYPEGT